MNKIIINEIFGVSESCYTNKSSQAFAEVKSLAERIMVIVFEQFCPVSASVEHSKYWKTNTVKINCKSDLLYDLCSRINDIMNAFEEDKFFFEEDSMNMNITHNGPDIQFHFEEKKEIFIYNFYNEDEYDHSQVSIIFPAAS